MESSNPSTSEDGNLLEYEKESNPILRAVVDRPDIFQALASAAVAQAPGGHGANLVLLAPQMAALPSAVQSCPVASAVAALPVALALSHAVYISRKNPLWLVSLDGSAGGVVRVRPLSKSSPLREAVVPVALPSQTSAMADARERFDRDAAAFEAAERAAESVDGILVLREFSLPWKNSTLHVLLLAQPWLPLTSWLPPASNSAVVSSPLRTNSSSSTTSRWSPWALLGGSSRQTAQSAPNLHAASPSGTAPVSASAALASAASPSPRTTLLHPDKEGGSQRSSLGGGANAAAEKQRRLMAQFYTRVRQPAAADINRRIRQYVDAFSARPPPAEDQAAHFHAFISGLITIISRHKLWSGADEASLDAAREAVERHVTSKLYSRMFGADADEVARDRALLVKMTLLSRFLQPEHLEILPNRLDEVRMAEAQTELRRINDYKAPADKVLCVAGSSLVSLSDGLAVPVSQLWTFQPVLSHMSASPAKNRGPSSGSYRIGPCEATDVWCSSGSADVVRISTGLARDLVCTPDHRVLIRRQDSGRPLWKQARALRCGSLDRMAVPLHSWVPLVHPKDSPPPSLSALWNDLTSLRTFVSHTLSENDMENRVGPKRPILDWALFRGLEHTVCREITAVVVGEQGQWDGEALVVDGRALAAWILSAVSQVLGDCGAQSLGTHMWALRDKAKTSYWLNVGTRPGARPSVRLGLAQASLAGLDACVDIAGNVAWVPVLRVESAGTAEVWDVTVPDSGSFVAQGVVVHNCVRNASKMLFSMLKVHGSANAGADDFLPVFVLALVRSRTPRIVSNVGYIKRFRQASRLFGSEAGYFFTNFELAASFLEELHAGRLSIDAEEYRRWMTPEENDVLPEPEDDAVSVVSRVTSSLSLFGGASDDDPAYDVGSRREDSPLPPRTSSFQQKDPDSASDDPWLAVRPEDIRVGEIPALLAAYRRLHRDRETLISLLREDQPSSSPARKGSSRPRRCSF